LRPKVDCPSRKRRGNTGVPLPGTGKGRSRVSNGATLFLDTSLTDKRSREWRRFRDLVVDISKDHGGADRLTAAQQQIIRRAATLSVWCELQESQFIQQGKEICIDTYARTSATLRRHLEVLGIRRHQRDISEGLEEYLSARQHIGGRKDILAAQKADREAAIIDNEEAEN
jgi:hypothetical protein